MSIDIQEATKLRKNWENLKKQNPSLKCEHPDFARESYSRGYTLDYVCIKCGELFYIEERNAILRSRKSSEL